VNYLKSLYYSHVQTAVGSMLAALSIFDLAGYHDSIAAFTGERGYHALRLVGAAVIVGRAMQVKNEKLPDQRPPGP
jgi:hypothetical protein